MDTPFIYRKKPNPVYKIHQFTPLFSNVQQPEKVVPLHNLIDHGDNPSVANL